MELVSMNQSEDIKDKNIQGIRKQNGTTRYQAQYIFVNFLEYQKIKLYGAAIILGCLQLNVF